MRVNLLPLHPAQQAIYDSPARFRVAACGRRFGKGVLSLDIELAAALRGGQVWHIAPDYPTSEIHWRLTKSVAAQLPGVKVREDEKMFAFAQGGYVQIKSANAVLRGESLDHLTIDEAAHIDGLAVLWTEQLRAALADRRGRALFTSTPFGLNDFHDLFALGQDPSEPEWASWQKPTSANPYILPSEIEAARKSLPARVFEQEWQAVFQSDSTGVFRCVGEVSVLQAQAGPISDHRYVFGVDWGRSEDFTVISIIDETTRHEAALDRFTGIGWQLQRERLKMLYERWRPVAIWAEENAIGGPNIEALQAEGLPVRPFTTTAKSKPELIDGLSLAIEKGAAGEDGGILLLDDPVQRAELQAFGYERLPSGTYRYGAPNGKHDDTVIALALGVYGARLTSRAISVEPVATVYDPSALIVWSIAEPSPDSVQQGAVVLIVQFAPDGHLSVIDEVDAPALSLPEALIDLAWKTAYPKPELIYIDRACQATRSVLMVRGIGHTGIAAHLPSEGLVNVRRLLAAGLLRVNGKCTRLVADLRQTTSDGELPPSVAALEQIAWTVRFNVPAPQTDEAMIDMKVVGIGYSGTPDGVQRLRELQDANTRDSAERFGRHFGW